MTAVAAFGLVLGMMIAQPGHAQITIDTVTVGEIGNAYDSTGYGGVSFVYSIAINETSLTQYTALLKAVAATDTYNLYNTSMGRNLNIAGIQRTGTSGSYSYSVIGSGESPGNVCELVRCGAFFQLACQWASRRGRWQRGRQVRN